MNREEMKIVTVDEYLDNFIENDGKIDMYIAKRAKKTKNILLIIRYSVKKKGKGVKLKVYNCIDFRTITRAINTNHKQKISVVEMTFPRKILGKTK